ncbi:putative AH/BAR domain superfamily protein [Helianthus anomalus]
MTNPIVSIQKIITINASGGVLGTDGQNKYILIRKDRSSEKVTDGDLADDIHPLGRVKMKQIIDKEKSVSVVIRRALDSIKSAGEKLYKRAALADFDLCINFEYNNKVQIPPPNNTIPAEIPSKQVRTGTIFDKPEMRVVFKDAHNEKALFRMSEISRFSNQTLKYIKNCMNEKQEQLKKKEKNNEQLRKAIKDSIDKWMEARGWYNELYKTTQKAKDYKKRRKLGDKYRSGMKIN